MEGARKKFKTIETNNFMNESSILLIANIKRSNSTPMNEIQIEHNMI